MAVVANSLARGRLGELVPRDRGEGMEERSCASLGARAALCPPRVEISNVSCGRSEPRSTLSRAREWQRSVPRGYGTLKQPFTVTCSRGSDEALDAIQATEDAAIQWGVQSGETLAATVARGSCH